MSVASQVEGNHVAIAAEERSDELPVDQRAPEAVQKDDRGALTAEVAHGELHTSGIHHEVFWAISHGAGDGTTEAGS